MKAITLQVSKRDTNLSRGNLNKMRETGSLPGVVYGPKVGSVAITVSKKELVNVLNTQGINAFISLRLDGKSVQVMIKEIQSHPVTGQYWHVDFSEISMDKKIRTEVQVQFIGEAEGVKEGGIVQYGDTTVEVECLPQNLPERFTLDITNLKIGDKLTVADLKPEEDVKVLAETEQVLITVLPPVMKKEDGEEQEEDGAPAEDAEKEE
jgi:large subunit ribosomal protein L25